MSDATSPTLSSSWQPLLASDPSLPLLHATIAWDRGSLLDPEGKEGASRILLRLMRRSAGGRDAEAIDNQIDRMGAHLGISVSRSVAAFQGSVISRSTAPFLELLQDAICRPSLDREEFTRLVDETRAELVERLNDDRALVRSFFSKKLFAGHPDSRPTSGSLSSLERLTWEDMQEQYRRLCTRERLRFAFSGHLDAKQLTDAARAIYEQLPPSETEVNDPPHPSVPAGRRLLFIDKPERTQTQILIGGLGTHPSDEDHFALHLGNTIFGGTFTARLSQEVRAKRGWSYGAYSSLPIDRRRQAFSMWTFPAQTDAAACIRLQLELLEDWVERGVTAKELRAAKKYLISSHVFSSDTASKRVSLLLDELLYELPPGYQEEYIERVQALSLDEVNQAIRKRISPQNLLIAIVGTHSQLGSQIREVIPQLAEDEVVRFDSPL